MLYLLSQLAHNLIRWPQRWMLEALETKRQIESPQANAQSAIALNRPKSSFAKLSIKQTKNGSATNFSNSGIKRWVRQMFALSGRVVIKRGSVTRLILNAAYPLIDRFVIAFETLLYYTPLEIAYFQASSDSCRVGTAHHQRGHVARQGSQPFIPN